MQGRGILIKFIVGVKTYSNVEYCVFFFKNKKFKKTNYIHTNAQRNGSRLYSTGSVIEKLRSSIIEKIKRIHWG